MMTVFKKIIFILLITILLITSGCIHAKKVESSTKNESIIMAIVNNEMPKEQLITRTYTVNSWSDIAVYGLTFEEVNNKFKIECLRSSGNEYYSIFKSQNGGWLYLLFSSESGKYIVTDIWYYEKPVYKIDFQKLILNKSTLADVRKIDKFGNEVLYASSVSPQSYHYTNDGYRIEIEYVIGKYGKIPGNLIISKVDIRPVSENSVYKHLLPIDREH